MKDQQPHASDVRLPAKCLKDVENAGYAEVIEVKLRNRADEELRSKKNRK
jgi:hypothetical protein